jgi:thioredoxin 1
MSTLKITKANFEQEVIKSDKPVLLDFWASWCGPCKMVGPTIDQIAVEAVNIAKVGKVNVDEEPELAQTFKVMSIPTLVVVKDGKVVQSSVGVKSKEAILNMIQ